MAIDLSAVGRTSGPEERSWTSFDCLLYALSIGAGTAELAFTSENCAGVPQQVLPTFPVIAGGGGNGLLSGVIDFDSPAVVHGEQGLQVYGPLPVEGHVRVTGKITGIYDKGSGALVVTQSDAVDTDSGDPVYTTWNSIFVRGAGGWGGERGQSQRSSVAPERTPDRTVSYHTREDQALLYRLNGDRNRLHCDPEFARHAGFDRPILHGLCTFGFTGRALLHALCEGDVGRFGRMEGRFTHPVYPGETLVVSIWDHGDEATFQTANERGQVVLDRGRFGRRSV